MNRLHKLTLAILAASFACLAQAADAPKTMRGADIPAGDPAPEVKAYAGKKPGLQQPIARTYKEQPPVIPHAVDNFDEITLEENQCLTCHGPDKYKEKKAPKIGESHFIDREGKQHAEVTHLRHNCVQCHVPQVDAPPLVENTFVGNIAASKDAKAKKK